MMAVGAVPAAILCIINKTVMDNGVILRLIGLIGLIRQISLISHIGLIGLIGLMGLMGNR